MKKKKKTVNKKRIGKKEMRKKISREVKAAILGSGRVIITFRKKAIDNSTLKDFCLMENRGEIIMNDECAALLSIAKHTGMWGNPKNRIVKIALGFNFNETEFTKIFIDDIKDIEAVK